MKRDSRLETLSWEHHHGLVVAFRLQRGLEKKAGTEILREYLLHIWGSALAHHFWQEEQTLLPALDALSEGNQLLGLMVDDHRDFRQMIRKIEGHPANLGAELSAFANKLNKHIRFEERLLFPYIENHVPAPQLKTIGEFLHEKHVSVNICWTDEFWK